MNPADFVSRYGYPKVTRFDGVAVGTMIVNRNPYRYLLYVTASGATAVLTPGEQDSIAAAGSGISQTVPLDIAFVRHGSLVCDAWFVSAIGGVANLLVFEGIASPDTQKRVEIGNDWQSISNQIAQSTEQYREYADPRAESQESSSVFQPIRSRDIRRRFGRRGSV